MVEFKKITDSDDDVMSDLRQHKLKEKSKKTVDFKTIKLHDIKVRSERAISKVLFAEAEDLHVPKHELKWQNLKESVFATLNQIKIGFSISKDQVGKELTYLILFAPKHMIRFQQQLVVSFVSFLICAPNVIFYIYELIEFKVEQCPEGSLETCERSKLHYKPLTYIILS